jgi:hypothetical protein
MGETDPQVALDGLETIGEQGLGTVKVARDIFADAIESYQLSVFIWTDPWSGITLLSPS